MAPFDFRLQPLLVLRRDQRERCRARLADACSAEARLAEDIAAVNALLAMHRQRMRAATAPGSLALGRLRVAAGYEEGLRERLAAIAHRQAAARAEVERCQCALATASNEVRALEELCVRGRQEYALEQQRRENRQADEAARKGTC